MTNSLKVQSNISKFFFFSHMKPKQDFAHEYIDRVIYLVYVVLVGKDNVVQAGRDKDKRKDIDDLFYILSQLIK